MAPGFKIKRIKPQKTLGDILKIRRLRKKVSLEKIEEETNIRLKFLTAIEEDNWNILPANIYGRGYLAQYAEYLGLDQAVILEKFDKERHLYCRDQDQLFSIRQFGQPLTTMWLLTPKNFLILVGFFAMMGLIIYINVQIREFAQAPELRIVQPGSSDKLIVQKDSLPIEGQTSPEARVEINGLMIDVNHDGTFKQEIGLNQGENIIVVTAENRNNKSRAKMVNVIANY